VGALTGEVTGDPTNNVVFNAVHTNTANAIVSRDGSGDFSAGSITLAENLNLPNTTGSRVGVVTLNGLRFLHAFGPSNTFLGESAGNFAMTGSGTTRPSSSTRSVFSPPVI
jgi:hypothetical protein